MKRAMIAASIATLACASPVLAHAHHHHHSPPKRARSHIVQRHYAASAYAAPAMPRESANICVFGYWCGDGILNDLPTTAPVASPRAKLKKRINRDRFQTEIAENPNLIVKMCHMVYGEVGRDAPLKAKIVQLETAFNRAQARGQTLEHVLLSVSESPQDGYYAGKNAPGGGTYGQYAEPTPTEVELFGIRVLRPVLDGSNLSDIGYGPMTGNASADVAAHQFAHGTPGYKLDGGDSYFREGPFLSDFPTLTPTELMAVLF